MMKRKFLISLAVQFVLVSILFSGNTPPSANLTKYLENMKRFENLLYKYTWFTEGPKDADFRNRGSMGEGLLERYGIDAFIYELNYVWIAALKKQPFGRDWELLGKELRDVFFDYFN